MKFGLYLLSALLALTTASIKDARADSQACNESRTLVTKLQTQVTTLAQQKAQKALAQYDNDRQSTDSDIFAQQDNSDRERAKDELNSQINHLAQMCKGQHDSNIGCDQLGALKKRVASYNRTARSSSKNRSSKGQQDSMGDSLKLDMALQDAQSDLEKAKTALNECREENGLNVPASTPSGSSRRGKNSEWSTF